MLNFSKDVLLMMLHWNIGRKKPLEIFFSMYFKMSISKWHAYFFFLKIKNKNKVDKF
jgi:hypothetical protein